MTGQRKYFSTAKLLYRRIIHRRGMVLIFWKDSYEFYVIAQAYTTYKVTRISNINFIRLNFLNWFNYLWNISHYKGGWWKWIRRYAKISSNIAESWYIHRHLRYSKLPYVSRLYFEQRCKSFWCMVCSEFYICHLKAVWIILQLQETIKRYALILKIPLILIEVLGRLDMFRKYDTFMFRS